MATPGSPSRLLLALALGAALCGCASGRYDWGGYDELLYHGYQSASRMDMLHHALERHIASLEARRETVAPGLYAELGTLCAERGDTARAVSMYAKERAAWPESRTLMDALIANIDHPVRPRREPAS